MKFIIELEIGLFFTEVCTSKPEDRSQHENSSARALKQQYVRACRTEIPEPSAKRSWSSRLLNGHDLGLFNVLAPLTNAAWLFGSIILAVSLKRAGKVPPAVAVGLPIAWVATIPLATVGGGVIAGAYYLAVGYLLVNHSAELTAPVAAQPANA